MNQKATCTITNKQRLIFYSFNIFLNNSEQILDENISFTSVKVAQFPLYSKYTKVPSRFTVHNRYAEVALSSHNTILSVSCTS